jgi:hypothetical protein
MCALLCVIACATDGCFEHAPCSLYELRELDIYVLGRNEFMYKGFNGTCIV